MSFPNNKGHSIDPLTGFKKVIFHPPSRRIIQNVLCNSFSQQISYFRSRLWPKLKVATGSLVLSFGVFSMGNSTVSGVNFVADVVDKVSPAVVFVEIKQRSPQTGKVVVVSNGSGFIVRKRGIVLTNAHVVANINRATVEVTLQDGRVCEGQVTAVDPICDLAAIKIDASNLTAIEIGNVSHLRSGEWVIALGSPLSLSKTVTCGIVSNTGRQSGEIGLRNKNMEYIQTDAVINFGNSGGPLVNMEGQAVGVNSMKITTGISFAIPGTYCQKFLNKAEDLMKHGRTENGFHKRKYMGITMLTLTKDLIKDQMSTFSIQKNSGDLVGGVYVYNVIPGTPAHFGGILAQDIIININGQKVVSAADIYEIVETSDTLRVKVLRKGVEKIIELNTQEVFG